MEEKISLYTDGAAKGNPGPGGFGVLLIYKNFKKEISSGFRMTTNNRMELLAVIEGLKALKVEGIPVTVYSDSKYVVDSVTKGWLWNWTKTGFKGKKNSDLWRKYIPLHQKYKPNFIWVKGHAGNPFNERCDQLAVEAATASFLPADEGYEASED
jgi:ribonuclease HI